MRVGAAKPHRWKAPPVETGGLVSGVSALKLGYSFTANTDASIAGNRALLAQAGTILNSHIMNFGLTNPSRGATTEGGVDWVASGQYQPIPVSGDATRHWFNFTTHLDERCGTTASTGWMQSASERVITFFNSPVWMRKPKPGSTYVDPWGGAAAAGYAPFASYAPTGAGLVASDNEPPHPDYFPEFAALCAEIAKRYPHVLHFDVWNEMKGMYQTVRSGGDGYDYQSYTAMFDAVYAAVKAVRPDAHIGGPYPVLTSWSFDQPSKHADNAEPDPLDRLNGAWGFGDKEQMAVVRYFLANVVALDALVLDLRNTCKDYQCSDYWPIATASQDNKWRGTPPAAPTRSAGDPYYDAPYFNPIDVWALSAKIGDVHTWVDAVIESIVAATPSRAWLRDLPVNYAEWYANAPVSVDFSGTWNGEVLDWTAAHPVSSDQAKLSVYAWNLIAAIEADVEMLLLWRPDGDASGHANNASGGGSDLALWDSSNVATALPAMLEKFKLHFSAGVELYTVATGSSLVRAIASATQLLLVSKSASPLTVNIDGANVELAAYDVRLVAR